MRTSSKEIAQRIVANKEDATWKGHTDGPVLTFAQATALYRSAGKSDRFLRALKISGSTTWLEVPGVLNCLMAFPAFL